MLIKLRNNIKLLQVNGRAVLVKDDGTITSLLHDWQSGDQQAFDELSQQVYAELHKRAQKYMFSERRGHTLQATALVNEVFVGLLKSDISFNDRGHFYRLAGGMMRRILVDHARGLACNKRGAGATHVTMIDWAMGNETQSFDVIALDDALQALAKYDQRKAQIIELQFFAGASIDEIAQFYAVSSRTIERDGKFAKAWLYRELNTTN